MAFPKKFISRRDNQPFSYDGLPYVNASWFGAVGDGFKDNTEAIMRSIRSAVEQGGAVVFDPGTYMVSIDPITAVALRLQHRNVRLIGLGGGGDVIIKAPDQSASYVALIGNPAGDETDLSGLTIEGITFDGNGDNNPVTSAAALNTFGRRIIRVTNGHHITIRNCRFTGVRGKQAINILTVDPQAPPSNPPSYVEVSNCTFDAFGGDTTEAYDTSALNIHARHQVITGNRFQGAIDTFGCVTAIEAHGENVVVANNTIADFVTGIFPFGGPGLSANLVISNNVIDRVVRGVVYGSGDSFPIESMTVSNNVIRIDTQSWITGAPATVPGGVLSVTSGSQGYRHLKILNNFIRYEPFTTDPAGTSAGTSGISVGLTSTTPVKRAIDVIGNTIMGSAGPGIAWFATTAQGRCYDNLVYNAVQSDAIIASAEYGIYIAGDVTDMDVSRNMIVDDQVTATILAGIFWNPSAASGLRVVRDNIIRTTSGTVHLLNVGGAATPPFGFGVGNQTPPAILGNDVAAAGPVGAVTAKIEVFDSRGVSLGFLPIYASIT